MSRLILEWNRLCGQITDPAGEGPSVGSLLPVPGRPLRKPSSITMPRVTPPPPESSVTHPLLTPSPESAAGAVVHTERVREMEAEDNVNNLREWLHEFGRLMAASHNKALESADQEKVRKCIDLAGVVVTRMVNLQAQGDPLVTLFGELVSQDAEIKAILERVTRGHVRTALDSEEDAEKWNDLAATFKVICRR